ncbi:MAG: hypothetical protein L6V84_07500 [Oscillospiraceae bacterium]|nr:MAG: hypothetical protein L6V84_07500 [Oscillospiraceae bacterium]
MNRKQSSEPGSPAFPPAACRALALHACAWFTVLSTLMLLIYAILDRAPSPLRLLLFLPLSLCFACAARIRHSSLSRAARTVSHALLTLGSAYGFVYLPVQIEQKPTAGTTLLFLFLSVLVYAIGTAILAAVAHRQGQPGSQRTTLPFAVRQTGSMNCGSGIRVPLKIHRTANKKCL